MKYKITVEILNDPEDKYSTTEIYTQTKDAEPKDFDLKKVIDAFNE